MIAPTLSRSAAEPYLIALVEGRTPETLLEELVGETGFPPRGDVAERIQTVQDRLEALTAGIDASEVARFDADAAAFLHEGLGSLPVRIASNRDFWRYLACGPLFEVARWRAPSGALENFGIGTLWRAVPERLWFRGNIGHDPDAGDPYHLVRRGGVDFWESGLIRVLYSSNPVLARALIRFQFPKDGEFKGNAYRPATLRMEGVRELWKRLRHFDAILDYSTIDEGRASALMEELSTGLPRGDGGFVD